MKKLMKILTVISLGVVATSVLAVMLCYVFRVPLLELVFNTGSELPVVVPVANAVLLVGQLGAMIWLCVCIGDRRFGIWAELLAVGWLAVVLPGISRLLSYVQVMAGRALGTDYLLAQNYMSNLWSYATIFNGVAVALVLVVCGASMAERHILKRGRQ
jgi:hypothetical protein